MIAIFGACGFVGNYLIETLKRRGEKFVACDINFDFGMKFYGKNFIEFDITRPVDFRKLPEGITTVIHLASIQPVNVMYEDTYDYVDVNINGTINILEYCRLNKIKKIIYISSVKSLSKRSRYIDEFTPKEIKYADEYTIFSITESCIEDLILHYSTKYGIKGIVFRVPPIYGYGSHLEGWRNGKPTKTGFLTFIENSQKGETIEIWGTNFHLKREFIYVKDVVSAIRKGINSKQSGIFNIAGKQPVSLLEEVACITGIFCKKGKRSKLSFNAKKENSLEMYTLDLTKTQSLLGWKPKYSFYDMLIDFKKEMKERRLFKRLVDKRRDELGGY
jgi:UDP-glucose 4-epimerase